MKKVKYAYIIIFAFFLVLPYGLQALLSDYISKENYEQRTLAAFPEININNLREFSTGFEDFFNDRTPFRTNMIELNSFINYHLFRTTTTDNVIVGKEDWLFLNNGSEYEDPMHDYYTENNLTEKELNEYAKRLSRFDDELKKEGIEFVFTIVQNKESVYGSDYLPDYYKRNHDRTSSDQLVEYLQNNTDINIVYTREAIEEARSSYPQYDYYYKADTHWNYLGAYVGTRQLLSKIGLNLPDIGDVTVSDWKIVSHDEPTDLAYIGGIRAITDCGISYGVSDYGERDYDSVPVPFYEGSPDFSVFTTCDTGIDKKICYIGDSYSNFVVPYIGSQYRECCFTKYWFIDLQTIKAYEPDVVVVEIVERRIKGLLNDYELLQF